MKITKESKNLGTLEFICHFCRTEFTADRGEYDQEIGTDSEFLGWKSGFLGFSSATSLRRETPCFIVTAACPSCENETTKRIPTGEKSYVDENYCGW